MTRTTPWRRAMAALAAAGVMTVSFAACAGDEPNAPGQEQENGDRGGGEGEGEGEDEGEGDG